MTVQIHLHRNDNKVSWGFRLTGGRDFSSPLTVSKIQKDSVSERGGLRVGDIITQIGDIQANQLTHGEAQKCIVHSLDNLKLTILRGSCPDVQKIFSPTHGSKNNTHPPQYDTLNFSDITKGSTSSRSVTSSVGSLYEDDSFDLYDQSYLESEDEFHEPTEKEIDEMLLENAEVLEGNGKSVIGVNFHRIIPQCNFIKDSAVFQVLQDEQVNKELSEREQLNKCPNKRFSTFLAPPDRPIPVPRKHKKQHNKKKETDTSKAQNSNKQDNEEKIKNVTAADVAEKERLKNLQICCRSPMTVCCISPKNIDSTTTVDINDDNYVNNQEEICSRNENNSSRNSLYETSIKHSNSNIAESNEVKENEIEEEIDTISNESDEKTVQFNTKLNNIKNTLNTLETLPTLIQSQLMHIQNQINELIKMKNNDAKQKNLAEEIIEEEEKFENDATTDENDEGEEKIEQNDEDYDENDGEITANMGDDEKSEDSDVDEQFVKETSVENPELEIKQTEQKRPNMDDFETEEERELRRRHMCPLTPLPRPLVLPGGRVWRKPQDAYNEEFIAETLISQAEVLVGSTMGVNFRKYEPPKFDMSNSAVYRLIHNIESKEQGNGLQNRDTLPAIEDYYQSPISAKHFYRSKLVDKVMSQMAESETDKKELVEKPETENVTEE